MRTALGCVRGATRGASNADRRVRAACGTSSAEQCWATSSTAATVPARRMAAVALMSRYFNAGCYAFGALSGPSLELSLASVCCKTLETLENKRPPFRFLPVLQVSPCQKTVAGTSLRGRSQPVWRPLPVRAEHWLYDAAACRAALSRYEGTHLLDANAPTNLRRPASTTALVLPQGRLAQASYSR
jgi:hypothetical protein